MPQSLVPWGRDLAVEDRDVRCAGLLPEGSPFALVIASVTTRTPTSSAKCAGAAARPARCTSSSITSKPRSSVASGVGSVAGQSARTAYRETTRLRWAAGTTTARCFRRHGSSEPPAQRRNSLLTSDRYRPTAPVCLLPLPCHRTRLRSPVSQKLPPVFALRSFVNRNLEDRKPIPLFRLSGTFRADHQRRARTIISGIP